MTLTQFPSGKQKGGVAGSSTQQIMKAPIPRVGFYVDEDGILYKNGKIVGELSPFDADSAIADLITQFRGLEDKEWRKRIRDQIRRIQQIQEMSEEDYGLSTEELRRRLWVQRIHGARPRINLEAIPVVKDRHKYLNGRVVVYGAKVRNPDEPITDWEYYDYIEWSDQGKPATVLVYDFRTDRMISVSSAIVDGHTAAEWFVGRPNLEDVVYILAYKDRHGAPNIATYGPAMGYDIENDSRMQLRALNQMKKQGYITGRENFDVNWASPETAKEGKLGVVKLHLRSLSE